MNRIRETLTPRRQRCRNIQKIRVAEQLTRKFSYFTNGLDSLVYRIEKNLEEIGEGVDEATGASIKEALEAAKPLLESEDPAALRAATEQLEKSSHALAEALYKKAQAEAETASADSAPGDESANGGPDGQGSGSNASNDDDDVVDADFEEVKP